MTNLKEPHDEVCPYSTLSLICYITPPIYAIIGLLFGGPIAFLVVYGTVVLLLVLLIKFAAKANYITVVSHEPHADHSHSYATSRNVISVSILLGIFTYVGLNMVMYGEKSEYQDLMPLGIYLTLLSFFHFSEYFVTSITNPSTLCLDSFLIANSYAYSLAIPISFLENTIEVYLFPRFKGFNCIALFGLVLAIGGQIVRKMAMLTAGRSFTHVISVRRDPDHHLVTHGIYSLVRHPAYAGWFYWAVGSQILLLNPICTILFTVMSYKFFKERIDYEEAILLDFFGREYEDYRKNVGLWMPIKLL